MLAILNNVAGGTTLEVLNRDLLRCFGRAGLPAELWDLFGREGGPDPGELAAMGRCRAILDINALNLEKMLPRLGPGPGPRYLISVDNPYYKRDKIKMLRPGDAVWLVDAANGPLVKRFLPPGVDLFFLPAPTIVPPGLLAAPPLPLEQRPIDVLFFGRFAQRQILTIADDLKLLYQRLCEAYRGEYSEPIYLAAGRIIGQEPALAHLKDEAFSGGFLQALGLFLWQVRCQRRLEVIKALAALSPTVRLHVVTEDVNTARALLTGDKVMVEGVKSWPEILGLMARAKIVINPEPLLVMGCHERVFASMAMGAALLSTRNLYLAKRFREGRDILFFDMPPRALAGQIQGLLADPAALAGVAGRGREEVLARETNQHRAAQLAEALFNSRARAGQAGGPGL